MDIVTYGQNIIASETQSLERMRVTMGESFKKAVEMILHAKGKLVVCGIGKSANIATKIVATLNSTGSHAAFLHAADAIHGDLGILQKGDVVLMMSKSGESSEMLELLTLIQQASYPIIAIVGATQSTLALQADIVLDTSIEYEAGEHNLAPTSSTTCQLVMGDALAMCLMKLRNFTPSDFAKYHPGGTLGKKLLLTVKAIASQNERPFVRLNASFEDTLLAISKGRLGAVVVLDEQDCIQGIITDGDLRRALEKKTTLLRAQEMMNPHAKTIDENELATTALAMLNEYHISQLITINKQQAYQGLIHLHDILKEGI